MLLFLFPPHMRIHAFLKSHISMRSYVVEPYNRKYYAVRSLNQLHSWDSGTIKEPGIARLKSHVLCTQSQAIPTDLRKPGDLELPFATLPTQLWRAQVLRRQLLLARSSKSQTTGSPASRNIKLFCSKWSRSMTNLAGTLNSRENNAGHEYKRGFSCPLTSTWTSKTNSLILSSQSNCLLIMVYTPVRYTW